MRTATLLALVVGCVVATGIVWLALGSRILLVMDRCFPGRPSAQAAEPLQIEAGRFAIGSRWYLLSESPAIELILDSRQRIVLRADGRAFTLGPVQKRWPTPPA